MKSEMTKNYFRLQGLALAVTAALALSACGGSGDNMASAASPTAAAQTTAGQNVPQPVQALATSSILNSVDFNNRAIGAYASADFQSDWGVSPPVSSGLSSGRLNIVQDPDPSNSSNKVLRVTYKANQIGGSSAMVFDAPIDGTRTNVWLQYRVRFNSNFTWVKGGKLPGLAGGDTPTGCIDNGTFDGFTTRLMWRENGVLHNYLYYPQKAERCGDYFDTGITFVKSRWYTITQQVKLNDVGQANGFLVQYVDGVKVNELKNWEWRKSASVTISAIKMDTFFGGSTDDWAPTADQYAYFDDFLVSTSNVFQ